MNLGIFRVLVYFYSFNSIIIELNNINIGTSILKYLDIDYFQAKIDGCFESNIIAFQDIIQSCNRSHLIESCRLPPPHGII